MRQKRDTTLYVEWSAANRSALKIVREHQEKYKRISALLDARPEILDLADRDLKVLSRGGQKQRRAVYTSENLLRALLVHTLEGRDLRGTVVLIAESPFLRDFLRLGNRPVLDFTFLDKAFQAIRPETWEAINAVLAGHAQATARLDPATIRVDTTVVETTIHYPTDAALLWDSWRVLARLLRRGRSLAPAWDAHRFHDGKVKRAYLRITRYAGSARRQRFVKHCYRELLAQVRRITAIAAAFALRARQEGGLALQALGAEIEGFLPAIQTVLATAERANVQGETVPAGERVFSLFEPHTELIRRGKSHKPIEFGHVVLLSETKEKFISDYVVMEQRVPDPALAGPTLARHERLFGAAPRVLAADKGFNPEPQKRAVLEQAVETLAIPRRLADWGGTLAPWQRFRAGIEGTISVLKRAYRLLRCPFRGFRRFAASVGMSIFCHNLVVLARPPGK